MFSVYYGFILTKQKQQQHYSLLISLYLYSHHYVSKDYLGQWFSTFLHQVRPQKISVSPSTTIITDAKIQVCGPHLCTVNTGGQFIPWIHGHSLVFCCIGDISIVMNPLSNLLLLKSWCALMLISVHVPQGENHWLNATVVVQFWEFSIFR